jgi:hypothetical protein
MRRIVTPLLALSLLVCAASIASAADKGAKPCNLFNGKNLDGWGCFLVEPDAKMKDVWSVKDGLLICKGEPHGYLATEKKFDNFKLVVEWRWAPGTKPGNSGVLMRITGKEMMLPNCVEAQLASGKAGDMYGFQGFKIDGDPTRKKLVSGHKLGGNLTALPKLAANEKEPGEWNKYEITADGGTITLKVNGKELNQATDCDSQAGQIALQSETGEIHFRTVCLTPLGK